MTRHDAGLEALVEPTRGLQPWRRVTHAASGLVLAWLPGAPGMTRDSLLLALAAVTAALLLLDLCRLRIPALNRLAFRALKPLISPREARSVASSTWYALGALCTYALVPVDVAVPAILVLALADPAAAVAGRRWGRRRVGKGSLVGAAAFFAVALAVLVGSLGAAPAMVARSLAAAAVATAVELAPVGPDDNLTVPLATAVTLQMALLVG